MEPACRWQRQPSESLSLGRTFRYKERLSFEFRAEFFNVFNPGVFSFGLPRRSDLLEGRFGGVIGAD
jgi:hypothetical protein